MRLQGLAGAARVVGTARTPTLLGKLRIKDFLPLKLVTRHCSWLNSTIRLSQSSSRMNLENTRVGQKKKRV